MAQSNDENVPQKCIVSPAALEAFLASPTHTLLVDFIVELNQSVIGIPLRTNDCVVSTAVESILALLDRVAEVIVRHPPTDTSSRFGNAAFRDFYDDVRRNASHWHENIPHLPAERIPEVATYFVQAWGDRERIDYGSGMELNFLCWLLCLRRVGVVSAQDDRALVLRVFWRYISIMRQLQSTYWLEPAGSHGVWGLDDYHFLPFLFGSAQLSGHQYLRPKSIHDPDVLEGFSDDFMYLACIQFINSIKTASLRWHSPMLDDISGVKTWEKVNIGMLKMYKAEVLGKLPVVQHFLFGSILQKPEWQEAVEDSPNDGHGHGHHQHGWGDCCGIPVPAAFAAAQANDKVVSQRGIRPIPFD